MTDNISAIGNVIHTSHVPTFPLMTTVEKAYATGTTNKNCLQTQVHFVAERKLSLEEVVRQLNELEGIQVVKLKQELLVR